MTADVLLPGDVRSLKDKRSYVRPVVAEIKRKYEVSVAETGDQELHGRAEIGAGVVSGERQHVVDVLDGCERLLLGRPELQILSVRQQVWNAAEDFE